MHRHIPLTFVVLFLAAAGPVISASAQPVNDVATPEPLVAFSRFEFGGDLLLPMDPLHEAFQPLAGTVLSMEDLFALAAVVESYYAQHGYPFVLAYFPEQTVEEGVVFMAVVVGRYGRIDLENRSRLKDSVASKVLRDLAPDAPIYVPELDSKTSRLQSLPGVTADILYAAGARFGQTDVTFELDDATRMEGSVTVATAGPPLFREAKLATDVAWLNPFGMADRMDVALSTDGFSTSRIDATYQAPVGIKLDYDFRAHASWSGYRLEGSWAGLGSGWDGAAGLGLARTWRMAAGSQIEGDVSVEVRRAHDEFIGSVTSHEVTSFKGSAAWTLADGSSVYRPKRWAVHVVVGNLALGTPGQRSLDAATAKTEGPFALVRVDADWQLPLARGTTNVRLSGQWAAKNLTSSEKFSLTQKLRSSPVGRGAGDDGWSVQFEYSPPPLSVPPLPGAWLATGFVDVGGVTYNKTPWDATGRGGRWAAGAGLRLDWQPVPGMTARLQQGWSVFDAAGIVAPGDAGPLSLSMTFSF